MKFIPYWGQIEVKPFEKKSVILSEDKRFVESGTVVAVGEGVEFFQVGDIAYFDAWKCRKAVDQDGEEHYIVSVDSEGTLGKNGKE